MPDATPPRSAASDVNEMPRYGPGELLAAQRETLASRRRRYGVLARIMFLAIDLIYGRAGSLRKFRVLEIVARVPYQTWEHVAYIAVTHTSTNPDFAREVQNRVVDARAAQDNETWHLLIFEELLRHDRHRHRLIRDIVLPQILAAVYYQVSWILYAVRPRWSYALNADFEDHALHTYMRYVADHPELEDLPWRTDFAAEYGSHATLADLLRQIAVDEREHRDHSVEMIGAARFGDDT